MTVTLAPPRPCESCLRNAVLETPYGLFCLDHTLELMDRDPDFWMPHMIERHSPVGV